MDPALSALQDVILDTLYTMSTFHSLSKLRIHTTMTLYLLEDVTVVLGSLLRKLRDEASKTLTVLELTRDVQARVRNQSRRGERQTQAASTAQKKVITLNLNTIKNHLLEHYPDCVRASGTMDGYSTSIVSRNVPEGSCLSPGIGRARALLF
jgi:hypothetical protein